MSWRGQSRFFVSFRMTLSNLAKKSDLHLVDNRFSSSFTPSFHHSVHANPTRNISIMSGKLAVAPPEALKKPIHVPEKTLMGPGPSNVSKRVLDAQALPTLGHLHPEYCQVGHISRVFSKNIKFLIFLDHGRGEGRDPVHLPDPEQADVGPVLDRPLRHGVRDDQHPRVRRRRPDRRQRDLGREVVRHGESPR